MRRFRYRRIGVILLEKSAGWKEITKYKVLEMMYQYKEKDLSCGPCRIRMECYGQSRYQHCMSPRYLSDFSVLQVYCKPMTMRKFPSMQQSVHWVELAKLTEVVLKHSLTRKIISRLLKCTTTIIILKSQRTWHTWQLQSPKRTQTWVNQKRNSFVGTIGWHI